MLSKKDFEAAASIIKGTFEGSWRADLQEMVDSLRREQAELFAIHFARSNLSFDRSRFMAACGVKS